jgi:3'(2'), 5'-bisphosphate nucleotidase
MAYEQEREIAIAAVKVAARLCEQVRQSRSESTLQKQDRSPVTIADFSAQAVICRALANAFPHDPIVGEESTTILRQPEMAERLQQITTYVQTIAPDATTDTILQWIDQGTGKVCDRYWTLDPIDGTKGFIRGDQYAIALALVEAGTVTVGVLGCPALTLTINGVEETGVLFVAAKGQGTTVSSLKHDNACVIQTAKQLQGVQLRLAESVEKEHGDRTLQQQVAKTIGLHNPPLEVDSLAKYGLVACGQAALYIRLPWVGELDYRENIWDHAAGVIVLEEAGGRVTDMHGKPLDFSAGLKLVNNQGIVAGNAALHDKALDTIRQLTSVKSLNP